MGAQPESFGNRRYAIDFWGKAWTRGSRGRKRDASDEMARESNVPDHAEASPSLVSLPACRDLLPQLDIADLRARLESSPWEKAGLGASWLREAAFAFGVQLFYERSHATAPHQLRPKRMVVESVLQAVEAEKEALGVSGGHVAHRRMRGHDSLLELSIAKAENEATAAGAEAVDLSFRPEFHAAPYGSLLAASLAKAERDTAAVGANDVRITLRCVETAMSQVRRQKRARVVFEWTATRGGSSLTARCERAANKLPEVLPLPYQIQTALKAFALPEAAKRLAIDAQSRPNTPAGTTIQCTHLGALKDNVVCLAGWCDNKDAVAAAFEPDPFLWPSTEGRGSHRLVGALWTWADEKVDMHWVAIARLDNLASNGQFWAPPAEIFRARVEALLREKADEETRLGKAKCLFVRVGWPDASDAKDASRAEAVFAFEHFFQDADRTMPDKVSVRLDHALDTDRRLPAHPQGRAIGGPQRTPIACSRACCHYMGSVHKCVWLRHLCQLGRYATHRRKRMAAIKEGEEVEHGPNRNRWQGAERPSDAGAQRYGRGAARLPWASTCQRGVLPQLGCHSQRRHPIAQVLLREDSKRGWPCWSACAPAGKYSLGDEPSGQYAVNMNAYWRWSAGHCICIPARNLMSLSDADFDMLAANTHPEWRTDCDYIRETRQRYFGNESLNAERNMNYYRSIEIASNEELFEEFGIPLSGSLAVDERTLSHMRAAKEEESRRQIAEAACTNVRLEKKRYMYTRMQLVLH